MNYQLPITSVGLAFLACLTVLVDDAMNVAVFHGLTVVNMLGGELAILLEKQLHQQ